MASGGGGVSAETDMAFGATRDRISGGPERRARRERIATAALQGLIAGTNGGDIPYVEAAGVLAKAAVMAADALIAELDKDGTK